MFATTHSPVAFRELAAPDIFAVQSSAGVTSIKSVSTTVQDANTAQRHLRATPKTCEKIVVGEGRTEEGLFRGLDIWWSDKGRDSFAFQAAATVDGGGKDNTPAFAEHLCDLGFKVFLLDSAASNGRYLETRPRQGGDAGTMARRMLDGRKIVSRSSWQGVAAMITYAVECTGQESVIAVVNITLAAANLDPVPDLAFPPARNVPEFRRALGKTAKDKSWFKGVTRGEKLAEIVGPHLDAIGATPFAQAMTPSGMGRWLTMRTRRSVGWLPAFVGAASSRLLVPAKQSRSRVALSFQIGGA